VGEAARPCRVMVRLQPVRTAGRLRRRSGLAGPLTVSQVASFSGLDADEISPGVHLLLAVFRRSDLGGAPLTLVVAGHNRRSGRMNRPMRGHLPDPGNSSHRSTPDRFRHGRSGDLGGMPKLVRRARSGTDHLGIIWGSSSRRSRRCGGAGACSRGRLIRSSSPPTRNWKPRSATSSGCTWTRRSGPSSSVSMKRRRSRAWTGPRRSSRSGPGSRTSRRMTTAGTARPTCSRPTTKLLRTRDTSRLTSDHFWDGCRGTKTRDFQR